ncbi:MAG TPA: RNB domain-containing ribonuclease [Deltaproteobacteria bacterium]|nr:RNB domain-containing ribonuclease [Deltaproteobacteria bacterium]
MPKTNALELKPGSVLEFFDDKELTCGVCLEVKNQRLRVLTAKNREINMAVNRVLLNTDGDLNLNEGREKLVRKLAEISQERQELAETVPVEELWELLVEEEEESYCCQELAEMVYSSPPSPNQVAAILRAILKDPFYFKYKDRRFYVNSPEKVEQIKIMLQREAEKEKQLVEGADWLSSIWKKQPAQEPDFKSKIIRLLKDFCVLGKDAPEYSFTKELLSRAKIPLVGGAFKLLVKLGEWKEDENILLYKYDVPIEFPREIDEEVRKIKEKVTEESLSDIGGREDLRDLELITIDGALTRDYDDALSFKELPGGEYEVGVHIADAAHFVEPGSLLDEEALMRAISIYLPDRRIPMLPPELSEEICSLWAEKDRLAISIFIKLDREIEVKDYRITPSLVRVKRQLTYTDVNLFLESEEIFQKLYQLTRRLREKRIERGASIIYVPEIRIWVNPEGMIQLSKQDEETPSQIIVSELMVLANALVARYFAEKGIPAIYRTQGEPRAEDRPASSDSVLFQKYRQRRLLSRAELSVEPLRHCSVGVSCYTTITSPIRRYLDLVMQRQLKTYLEKSEPFYTQEQLQDVINRIQEPQSNAMFIRRTWTRYWILKYLEQEDITVTEALVLDKGTRFYKLLLPDFMLEVNMKSDPKLDIQPGDTIKIRIERVNPREDILRVTLC